jgi:hypothetical protein
MGEGMQRKIPIMGLPGAGKTTLSRELAPLLGAVLFNADEVREDINRDLGFSRTGSSRSAAWAGFATGWWRRAARRLRIHLPHARSARGIRAGLHRVARSDQGGPLCRYQPAVSCRRKRSTSVWRRREPRASGADHAKDPPGVRSEEAHGFVGLSGAVSPAILGQIAGAHHDGRMRRHDGFDLVWRQGFAPLAGFAGAEELLRRPGSAPLYSSCLSPNNHATGALELARLQLIPLAALFRTLSIASGDDGTKQ